MRIFAGLPLYKVKRTNFFSQEEQNKSMELIVIIISVKDKNRLYSVFFSIVCFILKQYY